MLTSTSTTAPSKSKYPCLMQCIAPHNPDLIVLATGGNDSTFKGTAVTEGLTQGLGEARTDWMSRNFKPYTGDVTLSDT